MSIGLNHLTIDGNLTSDPDVKYLPKDKVVCQFAIAHNKKYVVNGEKREEVTFLDCTAWSKTAENIGKYFKKGSTIIVEGEIRQENWEDKNGGGKRSKICLRVERFHFVPDGKGRSDGESGGDDRQASVHAAPRTETAPAPRQSSDDEPPF
jgi:single-strand DNA-binding protein